MGAMFFDPPRTVTSGPGVSGIPLLLYIWAPRLPPWFSQTVMVPVPGLKTLTQSLKSPNCGSAAMRRGTCGGRQGEPAPSADRRRKLLAARLTLKFVQVWLMLGSESWTIIASTWCSTGIVWPNRMHGFCARGGGGGAGGFGCGHGDAGGCLP
eukprot:COSAG01_NODE_18308_length_1085_cov_3.831081_2_plen_153_part_00